MVALAGPRAGAATVHVRAYDERTATTPSIDRRLIEGLREREDAIVDRPVMGGPDASPAITAPEHQGPPALKLAKPPIVK